MKYAILFLASLAFLLSSLNVFAASKEKIIGQALICRDVSCAKSEAIHFDKIPEGVYVANPGTGLLAGVTKTASGYINFSVTGQKVIIDPTSGEWSGWAWATGPSGGWVKFDCTKTASCVKTIKVETPQSVQKKKNVSSKNHSLEFLEKTMQKIEDFYNIIGNSAINLSDQLSASVLYAYDASVSYLADTALYVNEKIQNLFESLPGSAVNAEPVGRENNPPPEVKIEIKEIKKADQNQKEFFNQIKEKIRLFQEY